MSLLTDKWWVNLENFHYCGNKYELEGVRSLMHPSDAVLLKKYMKVCNEQFYGPNYKVLDIGTYYGASAIIMAQVSNFDVITIDPNCKIDHKGNRGPLQEDRVAEVVGNFIRHGVDARIRRLDGLSEDIIWPREWEIPFMLIDGNHHLLNVLHEFYYFGRFVPVGGYVALHDYGKPNWPGVQRVVEEAVRFDGWEISDQEGYMCVLRRKNV